VVAVQSAQELADACASRFETCDILLMAAAVADFRPTAPAAAKLKKDAGVPVLELEPTPDVLSGLAERRRAGQVLVGFAAEHGEGGHEYARGKLERKRLDAIVLNDIGQSGIGFDSVENEVTILTADGAVRAVARSEKALVAEAILDEVERLSAPARSEESGGDARAGTRSVARV
jgi:phosphopantothenoylcysteine decarboxylase/phosphopantothenate--cysteine ligase